MTPPIPKQQSQFEHSQRLTIMLSWCTWEYEIIGNQKKQNKFKQRKPKPSISFQIQQSVKFLLPVIKKADKQLKMKHSHRTPLFTLFVLWRCVIHVSITDSIFLILPSLPSTCPPQHAVNHCDVLSTQNNSEFPIWSQKEGCSFSVSYKVSKCIRPFPHFYDTTSAEKMLI